MSAKDSFADFDLKFVETWESVVPGDIWIQKVNRRGEIEPFRCTPRKRFTLTTEDRFTTQETIARPENDPFQNGQFRPVVVPEGINIETSPNALSDEDITALFEASDLAWSEYLTVIDSPDTLRRMAELADDADIKLSRFRQLEARLLEVAPLPNAAQKDAELFEKIGGPSTPASAGKTPRKSSPPRKAPTSPSSTARGNEG
jgi:hypothetical protein